MNRADTMGTFGRFEEFARADLGWNMARGCNVFFFQAN